jgi:hypothetical protein
MLRSSRLLGRGLATCVKEDDSQGVDVLVARQCLALLFWALNLEMKQSHLAVCRFVPLSCEVEPTCACERIPPAIREQLHYFKGWFAIELAINGVDLLIFGLARRDDVVTPEYRSGYWRTLVCP